MRYEIDFYLGEQEWEFLSDLALRVRTFSVPQIARTRPKVVGRLDRLEAGGLIYSFVSMAHPELPLVGPVVSWRSGDQMPDFSKASYQLRSRWNLPGVPTKCVIASRAAGRMFGGHGGRYPRESEETHDIHLAAVYLRFRSISPLLTKSWIHEEEIKRDRKQRKGKLPDAMIGSRRVIEFGGAYKKAKLMAFHSFCESRGWEYEVW